MSVRPLTDHFLSGQDEVSSPKGGTFSSAHGSYSDGFGYFITGLTLTFFNAPLYLSGQDEVSSPKGGIAFFYATSEEAGVAGLHASRGEVAGNEISSDYRKSTLG